MDEKARARLAELEEMERRWMEANRVFKCHGCGVELGHVEFDSELPDPRNGFRRPVPTELRVRRGPTVALGGKPYRSFGTWHEFDAILQDGIPIQPVTDRNWSPIFTDVREGIRCNRCKAEYRATSLVPPFAYASELARLRRRAQSDCNEPRDAL